MNRFAIAQTLRRIGELLTLSGAPSFRARAYAKGATALESAADFDRLLAARQLTKLSGIGTGLAAVIEELAATGRSTLLEELESQLPPGAHELSAVLSLQPMRRIHEALGVDSLDALEAACLAGRVRGVVGFGEKTETRLLDKIRAHRARGRQMLLSEARSLAAELSDYLASTIPDVEIELVGDLRRGLELVDKIELLASDPLYPVDSAGAGVSPPVALALARHPRVERTEAGDGVDAPALRAWLAGGFCVALWVVAEADGLTRLTRTGPPAHVEALRTRLGSSERSFPDEAAVYQGAGLKPLPPELRDDPAALEFEAPEALVSATDIQGLVHCHTTWSDGRHSVAEMAQAAAARGLRYITFTDHSRTASYANGLDIDRMKRQWEEIDRLQETTSVRLLKGIESDILADGALDYPDEILGRLDVVIASIHARNGQSGAEMTRRLVTMMRHPIQKIWGHPLGRMLQRRPPIDCDIDLILETIVETDTIIELNGDPHRMDLPVDLARRARALGARFVASVDAHATGQLAYLDNAITLARRSGLTRAHVLNTLSPDEFADAVKPV